MNVCGIVIGKIVLTSLLLFKQIFSLSLLVKISFDLKKRTRNWEKRDWEVVSKSINRQNLRGWVGWKLIVSLRLKEKRSFLSEKV